MRRMLALASAGCLILTTLTVAPGLAATVVDCRAGADLQAAIDAAAPGDTLSIVGRCVGNVVIDRSMTIQGASGSPTIEGDGSGPAVLIHYTPGDIAIRLVGLAVTSGSPGIRLDPAAHIEVTVERSSISANPGGGVFMEPGFDNVVTITDSVLRGNDEFGAWNHGSPSSLRLEGTTVRDTAGDGVISDFDSSLTVRHSDIRGNAGAGIRYESASVYLEDSTVRGNAGGGIVSGTYRLILQIVRSRIVDNMSPGDGGGISTIDDPLATFHVRDSTIANNTAAGRGGGLFLTASQGATLTNVVFRNNRAGVDGGAMYLAAPGPVTLTDVTFHHNTPQDCVGC